MRSGYAVDGEVRPAERGEMKEAADVIVLVESGEEAFGFGNGESKRGEWNRLAELPCKREIAFDELGKGHRECAPGGFGSHGGSVLRKAPEVDGTNRPLWQPLFVADGRGW